MDLDATPARDFKRRADESAHLFIDIDGTPTLDFKRRAVESAHLVIDFDATPARNFKRRAGECASGRVEAGQAPAPAAPMTLLPWLDKVPGRGVRKRASIEREVWDGGLVWFQIWRSQMHGCISIFQQLRSGLIRFF